MANVRIGLFPPVDQLTGSPALHQILARAADEGVDHICVGDHVSFFVGAGSDGLISATSILAVQPAPPVYVGLSLLPLRPPVPGARQLATIAQLAPGRLTLGGGIVGEDPHEIEICRVAPKTRGQRMDERRKQHRRGRRVTTTAHQRRETGDSMRTNGGTNLSIQESLFPELTCFGCGHANPHGFHLRSYRESDITDAEFDPRPAHDNGFGYLNDGIIATILDCHGAAAVMWEVAERRWKTPTGTPTPFVTGSFDVTVRRPTPLGPTVQLTASPESVDPSQIIVRSELTADDKLRATMTATWAPFRPR